MAGQSQSNISIPVDLRHTSRVNTPATNVWLSVVTDFDSPLFAPQAGPAGTLTGERSTHGRTAILANP